MIHKKCDVFTPDEISFQMASFLNKDGNLLEPAVGDGALLKYVEHQDIDIYDIEQSYLDKIEKPVNKYCVDFLKTDISKKYKNIILNPPYIRIQELDEDYRLFIKNKFKNLNKGNIDIYMAFLLKCIDLLDDDGIMVSITPNSYLINRSAKKFRTYLINNRLIDRIIDFKSKKVFPKISVYCCITIFTKKPKEFLYFDNKIIYYNKLKTDFYEENNEPNLGSIVKISNGIATLRDKIYIHHHKLYDEPCWKKIFKVSKNIILWIIYPYDDNKIINEDKFKEDNPLTYQYLLSNKDELAKRDKGNKQYEKWYAFGRKQGLNISKKEKVLYVPTMGCMKFPIYKKEPILHISGLSVDITDNNYNLDNVYQKIDNNREFIYKRSSKRANDWFNISSNTLKKIKIC